jgi:hypothetical protein
MGISQPSLMIMLFPSAGSVLMWSFTAFLNTSKLVADHPAG